MKPTADNLISRREFIRYTSWVCAALSAPLLVSGCAVDPVTGQKQINFISRQQEIGIDQQQVPHQFSADYGVVQDANLNRYISKVGNGLLPHVHRRDMPYNFNCVNANYINAYAFPGGTVAISRGILLSLDNEAELGALIGHELGHVNARHSAEQMSKGQLSSILVSGLAMIAKTQDSSLGGLAQQLGMLGQGLLLSKYSRDNEREADTLGNAYMVKAGYPSSGFVGLMEMLDSLHDKQSNATTVLFSTHPMSSERLSSATARNNGVYAATNGRSLHRERYMDNTASLRAKRQGIELLQEGEKYMAKKQFDKSQVSFEQALAVMPSDYTAHMLLAKNHLVRKDPKAALAHAARAKKIYPAEAQCHLVSGLANANSEHYAAAYKDFSTYDKLLPGNPQVTFYKGLCLDKNGDRDPAAQNYMKYLKMVSYQSNKYSQYAYKKLQEWGYAP